MTEETAEKETNLYAEGAGCYRENKTGGMQRDLNTRASNDQSRHEYEQGPTNAPSFNANVIKTPLCTRFKLQKRLRTLIVHRFHSVVFSITQYFSLQRKNDPHSVRFSSKYLHCFFSLHFTIMKAHAAV